MRLNKDKSLKLKMMHQFAIEQNNQNKLYTTKLEHVYGRSNNSLF
jgi:hypothetical protein